MVRLLHLFALALPLLASASSPSSVVDLLESTFDEVVFESGKPSLVEFYAPWCGHCKKLAPTFDQLAEVFKQAGDKVTVAKIDCEAHKSIAKRFGVQGFPTLKWFDGKPGSEPVDYKSGRDLESLSNFITEKSGVKLKGKKAVPSNVEMLTDTTFKTQVGGDKDVMIAFTAPWCGHCKTLAPTWEKLADDFVLEPSVLIAKIDAEAENSKATAQDYDVTAYPALKFFPRGSTTPEAYSGARSEEALLEFINSRAGTHRVVGGGLDSTAGTVETIDSILAKYVTSAGIKDLEAVTAEVVAAAKGLKDKYAPYYVKALTKIGLNAGYATKEQTRLAGLLKKGGLAQEKIDDLTSRSNILSKFLVKEDEPKSEL